jgi:hypothetical protein
LEDEPDKEEQDLDDEDEEKYSKKIDKKKTHRDAKRLAGQLSSGDESDRGKQRGRSPSRGGRWRGTSSSSRRYSPWYQFLPRTGGSYRAGFRGGGRGSRGGAFIGHNSANYDPNLWSGGNRQDGNNYNNNYAPYYQKGANARRPRLPKPKK